MREDRPDQKPSRSSRRVCVACGGRGERSAVDHPEEVLGLPRPQRGTVGDEPFRSRVGVPREATIVG